jgi:hypothetical protein
MVHAGEYIGPCAIESQEAYDAQAGGPNLEFRF